MTTETGGGGIIFLLCREDASEVNWETNAAMAKRAATQLFVSGNFGGNDVCGMNGETANCEAGGHDEPNFPRLIFETASTSCLQ
jgi:hypothetical protein